MERRQSNPKQPLRARENGLAVVRFCASPAAARRPARGSGGRSRRSRRRPRHTGEAPNRLRPPGALGIPLLDELARNAGPFVEGAAGRGAFKKDSAVPDAVVAGAVEKLGSPVVFVPPSRKELREFRVRQIAHLVELPTLGNIPVAGPRHRAFIDPWQAARLVRQQRLDGIPHRR